MGALDGVRALAVLAVIAFHLGARPAGGGFLGVDVFFVLSGFLITDLIASRHAATGRLDLARFWARRARRLLPALAVTLVATTAATALIEPSALTGLRPALLAAATYSSNWYQAYHHLSYFASFGPPPPLQHLWSLAIEEQFYLAWPLLLLLLLTRVPSHRARAAAAWAGAAASATTMALLYHGGDPSRVYYGTDTHATALLTGAALALTTPLTRLTHATPTLTRRLDTAGITALAALAWATGHYTGNDPALYPYGLTLTALAAAALLAAAATPGHLNHLLSAKPLQWLGARSYGIYLWHWPVIALTTATTAPNPPPPWTWPLQTLLAITLAAISWKHLEQPILTNGLAHTTHTAITTLRTSITTTWKTPAHATPTLTTAAALTITCTAGYGILHPPAPATSAMQQQIAQGERVSAATQEHALAAPSVPPPPAGHAAKVPDRDVTAIGDSVMAAGAMSMQSALPGIYINAKPSRQMSAGLSIVRWLARTGRLRPVVVMGLGTNYIVTSSQLRELLRVLGPSRKLVLVNTHVPDGWSPQVNATMAAFVRQHPEVVLADWYDTIKNRTYLLWPDDIHPQLPGTRVYARLIYRAVQATRDVSSPDAPSPAAGRAAPPVVTQLPAPPQ